MNEDKNWITIESYLKMMKYRKTYIVCCISSFLTLIAVIVQGIKYGNSWIVIIEGIINILMFVLAIKGIRKTNVFIEGNTPNTHVLKELYAIHKNMKKMQVIERVRVKDGHPIDSFNLEQFFRSTCKKNRNYISDMITKVMINNEKVKILQQHWNEIPKTLSENEGLKDLEKNSYTAVQKELKQLNQYSNKLVIIFYCGDKNKGNYMERKALVDMETLKELNEKFKLESRAVDSKRKLVRKQKSHVI